MNRLSRVAIGAFAAALVADAARAELVGLAVFREGLYGNPVPSDTPLWIYRVYAEFTAGSDSVYAWGLGPTLGPGQILNITLSGSPGSGFNNVPDNDTGNLAPHHPPSPRDWDTYMTLGLLYGNNGPAGVDDTFVIGGTPTFISHGMTVWSSNGDAGAFLGNLSSPQGRGDYWVNGNDTNQRVMLMQLVVNAEEHVAGTIGVAWRRQQSGITISQQLTFSSVPTPSVGGMILIAVAMPLRRRNS